MEEFIEAVLGKRNNEVKHFLLEGYNPNLVVGPLNRSLLMVAVYNQDIEMVRALLEAGANTNHQDKNGLTALIDASYKGYGQIVDLLLQKDSDVNLVDYNFHTTALIAAVRGMELDIAKKLIQHGADPAVADIDGWTALHYAIYRKDIQMIETLVLLVDFNVDSLVEHAMSLLERDSISKEEFNCIQLALFRRLT
ncbi:ankyrin repeat protein [Croceifilum oryzae]|uniref:Ankyrin repeat protein n=1 Tax=Croceifilum oryzae TaxID=1553429 RepID=A0AAJ1TK35_9BACL|nr:ankyrin repeat domain-containing protein [Croceifilum oryzae]MDQ0417561.1 ankyrin repeat protein [Croceifilum oryzae]